MPQQVFAFKTARESSEFILGVSWLSRCSRRDKLSDCQLLSQGLLLHLSAWCGVEFSRCVWQPCLNVCRAVQDVSMYRRTSKVAGWPGFPITAVVRLTETILRVKRKKGTEGRKKKEEADTAGHIKVTRSFRCQEKKRKCSWEMAFSLDRP